MQILRKVISKWLALVVFASLGALTLSACSSGNSSSTTSQSSSNHPSSPNGSNSVIVKVPQDAQFCGLVTGAQIGSIFGDTFSDPHVSSSGGAAKEIDCDTTGQNNSLDVTFSLFVGHLCFNGEPASADCLKERQLAFADSKTEEQKSGFTIQPESGLGQQEYCATKTIVGVTTAFVNILDNWFMLETSGDTCDHAQQLAALLLPKI